MRRGGGGGEGGGETNVGVESRRLEFISGKKSRPNDITKLFELECREAWHNLLHRKPA